MGGRGWCYEAFLPDVMGLIIPMLKSPNALPFLLPFSSSKADLEMQEIARKTGLITYRKEGAGAAVDREPAWDVRPQGILQVALSVIEGSETQGQVPEMWHCQRTLANREV